MTQWFVCADSGLLVVTHSVWQVYLHPDIMRFAILLLLAATPACRTAFTVREASIADLRTALEQKPHDVARDRVSSISRASRTYEDRLNAVDHGESARARDRRLARPRARRRDAFADRCTAFPIALKDNIHTTDMPTTGGALAFADLVPPYDATLTKNLEAAGAIILAKTQLTELANWVASGMPGNYNGLTGYGMNPWDPRRDPRDAHFDGRPVLATGGSSSGVGTNVSFWAGNVGTETSGSILSPSNQNMLVGIKPTVGRDQPLRRHSDHGRPGHARPDDAHRRRRRDHARRDGGCRVPIRTIRRRRKCPPPAGRDYTRFLNPDGLKGARIGIPRAFFYDRDVGRRAPRRAAA